MRTLTTLFLSLTACIILTNCSNENESFYTEAKDKNPIDNNDTLINQNPTIDTESIIIYTNIEPDFTSDNIGDSYNLDVNNDDIVDFTLSSINESNYNWFVICQYSNNINSIISVTPWYIHPVPLDSNREIFNLSGYTNGESYDSWAIFNIGNCFGGEMGCYEDWKDKNDKYLGLRFLINGKTHYGWARLDVASITQWVVKDYAYNTTPNKPILAGQH